VNRFVRVLYADTSPDSACFESEENVGADD
jgi:hypothetical protein